MADPTEALILDLLQWIGTADRTYAETMEAWRTSCPRLPVWEEANDRGLILRELVGRSPMVRISPAGRRLLELYRDDTFTRCLDADPAAAR
jgi:hypothetical protein